MNQWALISNGAVVSVVTTNRTKREVEKLHPEYTVADLWSLPSNVQESYQFWNERP